jgi:hypothetical protein
MRDSLHSADFILSAGVLVPAPTGMDTAGSIGTATGKTTKTC